MKFLCGHCKAKYHIPDEKIAGRTLRMDCRRCGKEIILKGDPSRLSKRPPGAMGRRRPPSKASPLSADFREHVRTVPPSMPPPDQWHVAINDVPVGPVRTSEIQRKMSTGAVGADSLCWREGFDDWRPVRDVAELNALLQKAPPPPVQTPLGRGIHRTGSRSRPRIVSRSSHPAPALSSPPHPPVPPPSNVVPIGGRLGAILSVAQEPEEIPGDPTSISEPPIADPDAFVPVATPAPVSDDLPSRAGDDSLYPVRSRRRRGLPAGAWMAIAAAGGFGITLAFVVATKWLFPTPTPQTVVMNPPPTASTTTNVVGPTPEQGSSQASDETDAPDPSEVDETAEAENESTPAANKNGDRRNDRAQRRDPGGKQLSEEDRRRLERMGAGTSGPNLRNLTVGQQFNNTQRNQGEGLDAAQLNTVVSRNRPRLRSCYERGIRGMREPPEVRVNVSLTVGRTGRVTQASATGGNSISGLSNCVEGAVRRWVFPASGATTATQFPILFGGG